MAERNARRKVSFLLATTFAFGTGPAVIGAMAKDETPAPTMPIVPANIVDLRQRFAD